ncbi:hypothetical protein NUU61_000090 [Penicillium alfredii]|uniref:CENP-S associating centromere protein X-domain-containing protein n=1 Tax=Penicillium alfredii TaxID=1506179 RepID=A0A9W9KQN5_9EURO|nr:uncharacterized protein NUU61_000090 [Penicillium alfredii]KAJ5114331.1 hypothetical protein NUU61_000090 [Penicillium alfredii]
MPGEPQAAKKRRVLPFNPPSRASNAGPSTSAPKAKSKAKPSNKVSSASASKTAKLESKPTTSKKRARAESPPTAESASDAASQSEDEDESNRSRDRSLSQEPDYILAEITSAQQGDDVTSGDPAIPPKLLTKLLHHHFQSEKTKVAKDANGVVAKYVDVFVREAIARAAFERAETDDQAGGRGAGDGFLEVEDLEKMAPQLTMDF